MTELEFLPSELRAGVTAQELIADPAAWINRRVETVRMLTHEETRRQVSIDFTLSVAQEEGLSTEEGVVVPISVLTKEPRRNFDLRDESGAAVPVLGKGSNGRLAHIAALSAALDPLAAAEASDDAIELLAGDIGHIVSGAPAEAGAALEQIAAGAGSGNRLRGLVWEDEIAREMLQTLAGNYVLFAVLPPGGPRRRILKYSYGDALEALEVSFREQWRPSWLWLRATSPDRGRFFVQCPAADRAASFHAEIEVPSELRIEAAVLYDLENDLELSVVDSNVNRASLYANQSMDPHGDVTAYVEVVAERQGKPSLAVGAAAIVSILLWVGVLSHLDSRNPGSAVSILLAGAALFSGLLAVSGEHPLVSHLFSASRRWLSLVAVAALAASAALAMQAPSERPVGVWLVAAVIASVAAVRLGWAATRSPS